MSAQSRSPPDEVPDGTVRGCSATGDICTCARPLALTRREFKDRAPKAGRGEPTRTRTGGSGGGVFVPFVPVGFRGEGLGGQRGGGVGEPLCR